MQLIGHRGARALFPENTIEGFRDAIALGVRRFELDAAVSADGVVVVHHDPALNPDLARDAGGAWIEPPTPLLKSLTLQEISRFDVGRLRPGSAYAGSFPRQAPRDGARIPRLLDVLALDPDVHVTIEMKVLATRPEATVSPEAMAEHVAAVVDEAGAAARVMVSSFNWRAVRHFRAIRPEIPRAFLTEPATVSPLWWGAAHPGSVPQAVAAEGGGTWSPRHDGLTRAALQEAHALGLRVVPWTVNALPDMQRLAAWGVDGLITDAPDLWLAAAAV